MYQLDEKLMADNRAIVAISPNVGLLEKELKPGMLAYTGETRQLYVTTEQDIRRRVILENEAGEIDGNLVFADNLLIKGGLTIQGDLTNVETVDLVISDNLIELNKDETGAGVSKKVSGLFVNRGTLENYYLTFNESNGGAKACITHTVGEDVLSTLDINGDFFLKGRAYTKGLTSEKDVLVQDTLSVTKNALFGADVTINQNALIKSNLSVDGTALIKGKVTAQSDMDLLGALKVSKELNLQGAATLLSTLNVTGATELKSNLTVLGLTNMKDLNADNASLKANLNVLGETTLNKSLAVSNNLTVNQNALIKQDLTVNGSSNLKSLAVEDIVADSSTVNSLTVNDSALIKKDLEVSKNTNLTGTLTVGGLVTLNNDLLSQHKITVKDLESTNQITAKDLIGDNGNFNTLQVSGLSQLSQLNVSEQALFKKTVTIEQQLKTNSLLVDASILAKGNLTVEGNSDLRAILADGLTIGRTDTKITVSPSQIQLNHIAKNLSLSVSNSESAFVANTDIKLSSLNNTMLMLKESCIQSNKMIQVLNNNAYSNVLVQNGSHKSNHAFGSHDYLSPGDIKAVADHGVSGLYRGLSTSKPALANDGKILYATDTNSFYIDNGAWKKISVTEWDELNNKPTEFNPPIATPTVLGGIKVGQNVNVAPDGTLSVPDTVIEYITERTAFVLEEETNVLPYDVPVTDELHKYMLSVYVWGQLIPADNRAYVIREGKIMFVTDTLPVGTPVEIIALRIPLYVAFAQKQECYIATAGQTTFTIKGNYSINKSNLKVYVYGSLLPESAYEKVNSKTINLKDAPATGSVITIEYLDDPYTNTDTMIPDTIHIQEQEATVWTVIHNQSKYPNLLVVDHNGFKLDPITTQYIDYSTAILTFDKAVKGTVHVTR